MSLTARVSVFFLGALAVALVAFAAAIYWFAAESFDRDTEQRLLTTFHALAASAEIEPDGVEWNPREHHLANDRYAGETIPWIVTDDRKKVVDSSPGGRKALDFALAIESPAAGAIESVDSPSHERWWIISQRLVAPGEPQTIGSTEAAPADKPGDMPEYPALTVTAGVSLALRNPMLERLAIGLSTLALVVWLLAAAAGRWLCRRALAPVSAMADGARLLDVASPSARLVVPRSGDELEEMGRSFNDLLDRLHESLVGQSRFSTEASHQLRTPLAVLCGQIEVALRRERSADDYRAVLEQLQQQGTRLRQIIEGLLFLARTDAEARLPPLETIDLKAWTPEHLRWRKNEPRQAHLHFDDATSQSAWVAAQPMLLGQLLDTLLDNAFRYSAPGELVTVRLQNADARVELVVSDRGCGIAAEDLPHIFEPFYRARRTRQEHREGLGLGLGVASRIARALRAEISAANEPDRGARFTVSFPAISATVLESVNERPANSE